MTNVDAAVRGWLMASEAQLKEEQFVQADYDELGAVPPIKTAAQALQVFKAIVAIVAARQMNVIPLLVLPLPASTRRLTTAPQLGRFLHARWVGPELPGYYLTRPDLWSAWDDTEEYRLPVEAEDELDGLVCYYRLWRNRRSRNHGWEYERGFYIRTP